MWAFIIPILLQLLGDLLQYLFTKWLNGETLENHKDEYLAKVKWRFWLGPKRMEYASTLFDKACANYEKRRMFVRWPCDIASSRLLADEITYKLSV